MRMQRVLFILIAGVGGWATGVSAETFRANDLQTASLYGEQQTITESDRHTYLSRGQEYLRQYVQDNLRRFMSDSGVSMDLSHMQATATLDLQKLNPAQDTTNALPLEAKLRIWADEDLNNYLFCGRFIPLRMEMESLYHLGDTMDVSARVFAPFNDVMRLEVGSRYHWSEQVISRWQYTLRNDSEVRGNMNLGLGIQWADWQVALDYDMTPQFTQQQRISIGKNF